MTSSRRLTLSKDRWIGGVCGGLAEFVGWQPNTVRAVYVFASVVSAVFPGVLVYAVLWWIMPPPDGFDLERYRRD